MHIYKLYLYLNIVIISVIGSCQLFCSRHNGNGERSLIQLHCVPRSENRLCVFAGCNRQIPWIRILLEKLIVAKKFSGFYGTQISSTLLVKVSY
jgi:hypothetical protein